MESQLSAFGKQANDTFLASSNRLALHTQPHLFLEKIYSKFSTILKKYCFEKFLTLHINLNFQSKEPCLHYLQHLMCIGNYHFYNKK